MARPLPKTKAPALIKKRAIFPSVDVSKSQKPIPKRINWLAVLFFIHLGGAFTIIYNKPALINNKRFSCCVTKVITAAATKNSQSNQVVFIAGQFSLLIDFVVSLYELITMIPITAAPTP